MESVDTPARINTVARARKPIITRIILIIIEDQVVGVNIGEAVSHPLYRVYERKTLEQSGLTPLEIRKLTVAGETPRGTPKPKSKTRPTDNFESSMELPRTKELVRYSRNWDPKEFPREELTAPSRYSRNSAYLERVEAQGVREDLSDLRKERLLRGPRSLTKNPLPAEVFQNSSRVKIQDGKPRPI